MTYFFILRCKINLRLENKGKSGWIGSILPDKMKHSQRETVMEVIGVFLFGGC